MERESKRGVGRDAPGPHGYTIKIEHYLRQKGDEGATLDEIVAVALDEAWVGRGFANRVYAQRITNQRKIDNLSDGSGSVRQMTPAQVEMMNLHPNAVRYLLQEVLGPASRRGTWVVKDGTGKTARYFATGTGMKIKPHGWTAEQINQTPEQIGADMAMREVIRMLRPHMHQQTHKVSQAEWNAIRYWLNLAAIDWQP